MVYYSVKDSHGQKIYSVATSSSLASHWKCQVPQNTFSSFLVFHAVWKCPQKSRFLKISHLFMKLTLNFNFARIQKFIKMRHFSTTVYLLLCQLFQRGKKRENRSIWPNTWLCFYYNYSLNATVRPCAEKLREIFTCCQL